MNNSIIIKYSKLKLKIFYLPISILLFIFLFLVYKNALNVQNYVQIQKDLFYFLNSELSQFSSIQYNLTQLGDALVFLSLLTIFIIYAPKMWQALVSASLVSLIISSSLKNIFAVPRPAAILDHENCVFIGKILMGNSSLPSGHSITTFTIITVLLFSFMPIKEINKIFFIIMLVVLGIIFAFTRVCVGAHFPLDVIIGCVLGYISGLMGIFITKKYNFFYFFNLKKYYPFFILLFITCFIVIIKKILIENLFIYYLSAISIAFSLFQIIKIYVKK